MLMLVVILWRMLPVIVTRTRMCTRQHANISLLLRLHKTQAAYSTVQAQRFVGLPKVLGSFRQIRLQLHAAS